MMSAKKRTMGRMLFLTCLVVLFFMTHLYAASTTPQKPTGANVLQTQKPVLAKPMPDLIVKDVSLINNCSIKFIIQNIGNAGVAATTYLNTSKGFLKIYDGTKLLVDLNLKEADPYKRLRSAGGTEFGVALPGNYNPAGTHTINVVIDEINIVNERNENNNGLAKTLACAPPLQIKKMSIGSDAAGNCFVHIFLNKDGNKTLPLSASKISFSNRSSWNKIEWGDAQFISLTSFKNTVPYNSTCPSYPCTIHVSIDATFIKDLAGGALDGDYDGIPGGNFVQDIVVTGAGAWGVFNH